MKALFDTSVLIAAFTIEHPKHTACLPYLQKVRNEQIDGYISTHCIAELYSVLTARTSPRILPADARNIMGTDLPRFQVVDMNGSDYLTVVDRMVALGLSGGAIYDALHAYAAHKVEADTILTLNFCDFNRLGLDIAAKVVVP